MASTRIQYGSEVAEYRRAKHLRAEAASLNRSRRMRGLPALPLPVLPSAPPRMFHIMLGDDYHGAVLAKSRREALDCYAEDCEETGTEPATGVRAVLAPGKGG